MKCKKFAAKLVSYVLVCCMMTGLFSGAGTLRTEAVQTTGTYVSAACMDSYAAGKTLTTGYYYLTKSKTISAGTGGNALAISGTVVLEIPKGVELIVRGGNGSGSSSGGAGIYLPSGSKLYLIGEGKLKAYGGAAGNGSGGNGGGGPSLDEDDNYFYTGSGGSGGNGGGGAGAGIGTKGGNGGSGGSGGSSSSKQKFENKDYRWVYGNAGSSGGTGSSSAEMGALYILGKVTVEATGGSGASGGSYGTNNNSRRTDYAKIGALKLNKTYASVGGGAGGGGGGGGYPAANIGSGGSGGGGGGGGGAGGARVDDDEYKSQSQLRAEAGRGGSGYSNGSSSGQSDGKAGGYGGSGGGSYSSGKGGYIYRVSTATYTGKPSNYNSSCYGKGASSYVGNYTTSVTLNLVDTGLGLKDRTMSIFRDETEGLGEKTGRAEINIGRTMLSDYDTSEFSHTGYTLDGWYTQPDGGIKVLNSDGTIAVSDVNDYVSDGGWNTIHNTTLYAKWIANNYKVLYEPNGGLGKKTVVVTYDEEFPELTYNELNRKGYNLLSITADKAGDGKKYYDNNENGWVKNEELYIYPNDITIFAQWEPIKYNINFWTETDEGTTECIGTYEDVVYDRYSLPNVSEFGVSRAHYNFQGWNIYSGQDWSMYKSNVLYTGGLASEEGETVDAYATWKIFDNYTISYQGNGGTRVPPSDFAFYGDDYYIDSTIPMRDGYTFCGWDNMPSATNAVYKPGDMIEQISSNYTLYAVWKRNSTVSYNVNGGVVDVSIETLYPAKGESVLVTDAEPRKTGYIFRGWSTNPDSEEALAGMIYKAGDSVVMEDSSIVLYAVWEQISQVANFMFDSSLCVLSDTKTGVAIEGEDTFYYGTNYTFYVRYRKNVISAEKMQVLVNQSLLLPASEEEVDIDGILYLVRTYTVSGATKDLQVEVSGLEKVTYALGYHLNGGTLSQAQTFYAPGQEYTLEIPERDGYEFAGWYTKSDLTGTSVDKIGENEIGNKEFYASWTPITYTIKYNVNDASPSPETKISDTMTYDMFYVLSSADELQFEHGDYKFLGWSLDAADEAPLYKAGQKIQNLASQNGAEVELFAIWDVPLYKVSFDTSGADKEDTELSGGEDIKLLGGEQEEEEEEPEQDSPAEDSLFSPVVVKSGNTVTLNLPERTGYEFEYWTDGENQYQPEEVAVIVKDTVFTASWKPISYTVNYNEGSVSENSVVENTMPQQQSMNYDERKQLEDGPAFVNDLKKFLGWSKDTDAETPSFLDRQWVLNLTTVKDAVVELFAIWGDADEYFVTYNANGGSGDVPETVKVTTTGDFVPATTDGLNLTRTGYVLKGWSTDKEAIQAESSIVIEPETDYTLYAVWEKETFKVEYAYLAPSAAEDEGAVVMKTVEFSYDEKVTMLTAEEAGITEPALYNLDGWSDINDFIYHVGSTFTPNEDVYVVASWSIDPEAVKLSYDPNGATGDAAGVRNTEYFEKDAVADIVFENPTGDGAQKEIPERAGYTFLGWDEDPAAVVPAYTSDGTKNISMTSDKILYAVWEKNPVYRVIYDANADGDYSVPINLKEYEKGDVAEVDFGTIPSRSGYTFLGWSTISDASTPEFAPMTADDEGGEESTPQSAPTVIVNSDVTLYAVWQLGTYKVELYNYDLTAKEASEFPLCEETVDLGNDYNLPKADEIPTLDAPLGHKFAGWSFTAGGEASHEDEGQIDSTSLSNGSVVKLYAVWKPITITITFNNDNGEANPTESFVYGEGLPEIFFSVPEKYGYVFEGYYFDDEQKKYYSESLEPLKRWEGAEEQIEFKALWRKAEFTVTYCNAIGVVICVEKYAVGDEQKKLLTTAMLSQNYGYEVENGKTFTGWSDEVGGQVIYSDGYPINQIEAVGDQTIYLFAIEKSGAKCYLHYDSNGGIGGPSGYTVSAAGEEIILNFFDVPSREGYIFLGWSENANAVSPEYMNRPGGNVYQTTESKALIDLYAVWQKNEKTDVDTSDKILMAVLTNTYGFECEINSKPDLSGMIVLALYTDGTTKIVTNYKTNIDNINFAKSGKTKLQISYTENGITKNAYIPLEIIGDSSEEEQPTQQEEQKEEQPTQQEEQKEEQKKEVMDKFSVTEEVAKQIVEYAEKANIPSEVLLTTTEAITAAATEEIKGANFAMLQARAAKVKKTSIKIQWNKVKDADGYIVYGNQCGKKMKVLKTYNSKNKVTYTQKKLKKSKYYKYTVIAYKLIGGKKVTIAISPTIHVATTGGKLANPKSIKLNKTSVSLKVNKTFKIKVKITKSGKVQKNHRKVKYVSSDTNIATVSSSGKIKAKKKGTCYVYVYSQSGLYKRVKVKVK